MKLKWEPLWECDDDVGNHTSWSAEINHPTYGKYVWISIVKNGYNESYYAVEVFTENDYIALVTCKSLTSAKRWVSANLTGFSGEP